MFLGLFIAGTMMSFTSLNATEMIPVEEDFGVCCAASGGGHSVTYCEGGFDTGHACSVAQDLLELTKL
ncbi:hypothetical protein [uncultured Aquimarina sp.]|uniref:hypothetical protein n=1 Tax=uncultured Aquimarina sp. TaxID=575652 RepID=UPI00261FB3D7|nr:hypothetical protein [uncultured Aquimarina sp.]